MNQFSKKLNWLASTASDRKDANIQLDILRLYTQKIFFQTIKIKLNSRTWMTLKSQGVIFQSLQPLQPQWPQQPQQPQWPQWPEQPHFIKKITDPDSWIIPGTKRTNTHPFLWNWSSKIQFFTNIRFLFCWRLLRPADAIFLKTVWWNTNEQPLWPCSQTYTIKILISSAPQRCLL